MHWKPGPEQHPGAENQESLMPDMDRAHTKGVMQPHSEKGS